MILHADEHFVISFGEKTESFAPASLYKTTSETALLTTEPFAPVSRLMGLACGIVLKQTHGTLGYVIKSYCDLARFKPYANEGDYLITSLSGVGLAVATADCLPIVMYDPRAHVIGIVHAGRIGSLAGIACKMLEDFQQVYGTEAADMRVFFGPSACSCCYEIRQDCVRDILASGYDPECKTISERDGKTYFDLPLFNRMILEDCGVRPSAFDMRYNACTVCTPSFCSYRREGERANRQMTVAALK